MVFPAEDEFPVLFAAPGCAWGGHRMQSQSAAVMGRNLFSRRIKIVKKTSLSLDSFGTKRHWEGAGGLLVLGRRMVCGSFSPSSYFHRQGGIQRDLSSP